MNQFLKRTFRILNKPSEGRKTFQPLGEPTRLSTSIFCENKDAHKSLDSPLVYVGTHNVRLVMLKRPLRKSNPAAAFLA
ncbi:TPA: hypothetical protein F6W00_24720 [Escherichia coli]|nr:hypothetical protein [Escherichia coli]